jgi:hypothetical protein
MSKNPCWCHRTIVPIQYPLHTHAVPHHLTCVHRCGSTFLVCFSRHPFQNLQFWCVFHGIHFKTFNACRGSKETRLAPGLLSARHAHGNLATTPPDTGAHSPLLPDDATKVFPAMQARAVVYLISPLVECTVPVLALVILLAYHSDGSYVPPSSSLPLLSSNPCWCHRA